MRRWRNVLRIATDARSALKGEQKRKRRGAAFCCDRRRRSRLRECRLRDRQSASAAAAAATTGKNGGCTNSNAETSYKSSIHIVSVSRYSMIRFRPNLIALFMCGLARHLRRRSHHASRLDAPMAKLSRNFRNFFSCGSDRTVVSRAQNHLSGGCSADRALALHGANA